QRGQIERGEIPLALAREDEWQGDRSLEQVRPARLARALDRSGDIQDVVEHLEREPDAAGESARRGGPLLGPRRRPARPPAVAAPVAAVSAPRRQAASNSASVFSSQRLR